MKYLYGFLAFLLLFSITSQASNSEDVHHTLFTQLYNRNMSGSLQSESYDSAELLSVQHVAAHIKELSTDTTTIDLQLTPNLMVTAEKTNAFFNEQGGLVWQGRMDEDEGDLTLVRFQDQLAGTVRLEDQQFEISALDIKTDQNNGRIHEIAEIDLENQMPDHAPDFNESLLVSEEARKTYEHAKLLESVHSVNSEKKSRAATIRVIVAYTTDTPSSVQSKIQQAIAETNTGYSSSGINARVQLAHSYETPYRGSGNHGRDLDRFHNRGDGYMDEIFSLRNQYSADVAILIINDASACGRARAIGANESNAYAVVKLSCATGYFSFGHEIGHLLSARHDPASDSKTYPYRDGHGYCYPSGNWRSIMSYNNGCQSRKNFWSDPTRTYNGVRRGTTDMSNNSRVLNITVYEIARFRSHRSELWME